MFFKNKKQIPYLWGLPEDKYLIFMHLSLLVGIIFPFFGFLFTYFFIYPFWQENETIKKHALKIFDWFASFIVFFIISTILIVSVIGIVIGLPMMIVLIFLSIVYPIMGAIKAAKGQLFSYPLALNIHRNFNL